MSSTTVTSMGTFDGSLQFVGGGPIPLTTLFTLPSMCSTRWIMQHKNSIYSGLSLISVTNSSSLIIISSSYIANCNPYGVGSSEYSPGVCPSGQTFTVQKSWTLESWGGYCCPSGMTINETAQGCLGEFTTPLTVIVGYTSANSTLWDETVVEVGRSSKGTSVYKNTTVIDSGFAIVAPSWVEWQRKDLSLFPPAYASSVATQVGIEFTATPTVSPGQASSIPPPTSTTNSTRHHYMSEEAKIGVGVGSALGALAYGAIIFTIIWWLRRKREKPHPNEPELQGHSRGLKIFLRGKWRAEAEGLSQPVETDGRSVKIIPGPPRELEA